MASQLGVSIRLLDSTFHGCVATGEPEWPPSPLRLFQALVASAAARSRATWRSGPAVETLRWLERLPPPTIVAPEEQVGAPFRTAVPNNDLDIVASALAWGRGPKRQPNELKTMKTIRSVRLVGGGAVHYLWRLADPLDEEVRSHVERLSALARSIVVVGWGIDMAVGDAAVVSDDEADAIPGERWSAEHAPAHDGLRVPVGGTLEALIERHERFVTRLDRGSFASPPQMTAFRTWAYRRASDPPARPIAALSLLRPDGSGFRPFDTVRRGSAVAAMVRHATGLAATRAGWPPQKIASFILGHGEEQGSKHVAVGPRRLAYLPAPSLEARGDGRTRACRSIRRVIMCAFAGDCGDEIRWLRVALPGTELTDERTRETPAIVGFLPTGDRVVRQYTAPAESWATVTPVVLPGFDDPSHYRRRIGRGVAADEKRRLLDRLHERIDGLVRKAIIQAGFSSTLAANAAIEWRQAGFWPGADLCDRYVVSEHLRRYPRMHVRLGWRDAAGRSLRVPGPICLGGGRFCGTGLFAALPPMP